MRIASVAVSNMKALGDRLFDYCVPEKLRNTVRPGAFVLIGFGKADKRTKGIVFSLRDGEPERKLKPIYAVLDNSALLSDEAMKIAEYVTKRCFCTYYDAARLLIPYGCDFNVEETVSALPQENGAAPMSPLEEEIYRYVSEKERVAVTAILDSFGDSARMVLGTLRSKGYITTDADVRQNVGDLLVRLVSIAVDGKTLDGILKSKRTGARQAALLEYLKEHGESSVKEVCYMTGASAAAVNGYIKKGVLSARLEQVYRLPKITESESPAEIVLNDEQQAAFEGILSKEGFSPSLLYGVTGSGKTHIYLKLCENAVNHGKTAIVLMPEIALTSQVITRFYRVFGRKIAIIHSALSAGERSDEWKRLKNGDAVIAVGTRSAIFAPVSNVGVIIIDEEQEHTYKSEMTPRYSARDVALFRGKYNKCPVVFSSATPSVATYSKAASGAYGLYKLTKRFNGEPLPSVTVVDMREEQSKGNTGIISEKLYDEIAGNLKRGEQTLLFLNRRSYNWFISCRNCGNAVTCPKCSISLTYHSENRRLMCHHCGYSTEFTEVCPTCGKKALKFFGTGTQKVVSELELLFPDARIMRLDADSTVRKNSHDEILSAFAAGEADILVGTQMIAKGLDFPRVTLAAVLLADFTIYSDDYKANEKTFAQITQVIGRAGRAELSGRAIVQTYAPDNRVLNLAVTQNYEAFYKEEIELRKKLTYPPYCDICQMTFESEREALAREAAEAVASECVTVRATKYPDMPLIGLGPSQARVLKVNNVYKYKLVLKCRINKDLCDLAESAASWFDGEKRFQDVLMSVEYNPENIA